MKMSVEIIYVSIVTLIGGLMVYYGKADLKDYGFWLLGFFNGKMFKCCVVENDKSVDDKKDLVKNDGQCPVGVCNA